MIVVPLYEATVESAFTAGHAIRLADGNCEPPHEHLWRVTATFQAEALAQPTGVVIDFLAVRGALQSVADELAGRNLNALAEFRDRSPSAERVAELVAAMVMERLGGNAGGDCGRGLRLWRLAVTEAPGCEAAYYPGRRGEA